MIIYSGMHRKSMEAAHTLSNDILKEKGAFPDDEDSLSSEENELTEQKPKIDEKDEFSIMTILKRFLSLYDLITDAIYFNAVYWFSMKPGNQCNSDYKIAALISFMSFISPFWISYSGLTTIQNQQGSIGQQER